MHLWVNITSCMSRPKKYIFSNTTIYWKKWKCKINYQLNSNHEIQEDECGVLSFLCFSTFEIKMPMLAANNKIISIQRVSLIQKFLFLISRVFLSAIFALALISWFISMFLLRTYRWAPSSVATLLVVSLVYSATLAIFFNRSLWPWIWEFISTNSLCLGSRLNPYSSSIILDQVCRLNNFNSDIFNFIALFLSIWNFIIHPNYLKIIYGIVKSGLQNCCFRQEPCRTDSRISA